MRNTVMLTVNHQFWLGAERRPPAAIMSHDRYKRYSKNRGNILYREERVGLNRSKHAIYRFGSNRESVLDRLNGWNMDLIWFGYALFLINFFLLNCLTLKAIFLYSNISLGLINLILWILAFLQAYNSSSTIASIQQMPPQLGCSQVSKAVEMREALLPRRTSPAAPTHQRFIANYCLIRCYDELVHCS